MTYKPNQAMQWRTVTASVHSRPLTRTARGLLITLVFLALTIAQSPPAQRKHVVVIRQMRFNPSALAVADGDSVEWKNEDIFTHTVTANDGSFDSGPIPPNSTWQTTMKRAGTLAYHCEPHPNMVAELVVEAVGDHGPSGQGEPPSHRHGNRALKWTVPNKPEQLHPILVNFTAALLPLALLSDVLGRVFRRSALNAAAFWMVLYAAVITPLTAAAGWWWKSSIGPESDGALLTVHQWLGSAAALLSAFLAIWRWRIYKRDVAPDFGYLASALLVVIALVYQGSLGGAMVFGR